MKNLLLNSLLLLLLGACSPGHYGQLKKTSQPSSPAPVFGQNFNSFIFKTNIRLYGKDISGLLIAKQVEPQDYRIVFTNELGLKFFDFEFKDTTFTLHYCVPQFNRPSLIRILQEDITLLLMNNLGGKPVVSFTDKEEKYKIQRLPGTIGYDYYFTDKSKGVLTRIEHSKKHSKKVVISINEYKNNFPSNIVIKHYNIKLNIAMNLISN